MPAKKRHHFVPATYLRNFTDEKGWLNVYRKDEPAQILRQKPETTGFENFYYSQIDDAGQRDDDRLEDIFSDVERWWPEIIRALRAFERNFTAAPHLLEFVALMRVRGPAFRDSVETRMSSMVSTEMKVLDAAGLLPEKPQGFEDILDHVVVSIDPQVSLHAMATVLPSIGEVLSKLSYEVLHNDTDLALLTCDNPVIYYDPSVGPLRRLPYTVVPDGPIELVFPLSSDMMLRAKARPTRDYISHRTIRDRSSIRKFNREVSRYGYRMVFGADTKSSAVIAQHADLSPVVREDEIPHPRGGRISLAQMVFGPRKRKPKWTGGQRSEDR